MDVTKWPWASSIVLRRRPAFRSNTRIVRSSDAEMRNFDDACHAMLRTQLSCENIITHCDVDTCHNLTVLSRDPVASVSARGAPAASAGAAAAGGCGALSNASGGTGAAGSVERAAPGAHAIASITCSCPDSTHAHCHCASAFHTRTCWSLPALASHAPSRLEATHRTQSVWPLSDRVQYLC